MEGVKGVPNTRIMVIKMIIQSIGIQFHEDDQTRVRTLGLNTPHSSTITYSQQNTNFKQHFTTENRKSYYSLTSWQN